MSSTCRTVAVDLSAFSLDAIKRAAYRFTHRFAIEINVEGKAASCSLLFNDDVSDEIMDRTVLEFRKELLDQDLRATIRDETKDVRNLILAHAFSRTGLIADESIPAA